MARVIYLIMKMDEPASGAGRSLPMTNFPHNQFRLAVGAVKVFIC